MVVETVRIGLQRLVRLQPEDAVRIALHLNGDGSEPAMWRACGHILARSVRHQRRSSGGQCSFAEVSLIPILVKRAQGAALMRYAVVIEKAEGNYSAFVPDLPGCVATGDTVASVEHEIREAIRFHIEGLKQDGLDVPAATSIAEYIEA
jgi:predicted RNase H-like HicB family nuclease